MEEKKMTNHVQTDATEASKLSDNQALSRKDLPADAPDLVPATGLTIGRRLLLGGAVGIIIVLVAVGIAFYLVTAIAQSFEKVTEDAWVEEKALDVIQGAVATILSETREYALLGEGETLEEIDEAAEALTQALTAFAGTERADEAEEEEEFEVLDQLESAATGIVRESAAIISLVDQGADEEELEEALGEGLEEAETAFEIALAAARAVSDEEVAETSEAAVRAVERLEIFMIVFPIVAVVLVGGLSYGLWRSIARRVEGLAETAQAIAAGDLQRQAQVDSSDELGVLANAFNQMTAALQAQIALSQAQSRRLEIVATLSERLNAILDFDQLLLELVHQVKDTFGYYHAHVYVLDDTKQNLVMAAGAGEAGKQMKAKGHHIALDAPTSLVARAARTNQIVSVDKVREAPDWLPNPLLPDTRAEMAVPIVLEGQVVGVLDVQQDEVAGLDEGDANLLRSLANQVAVAIRNARLFAEVEEALAESQAAQERYLEQSWQQARIAARGGQYHYARAEAPALADSAIAEAKQAALLQHDLAVVALEINGSDAPEKPAKTIVAPIKYRDLAIGAMQLHPLRDDQTWSEDDLAVVAAVVDELAQTAENLRLFDETRERAGREQTIREITDKLRAAPDLNSLVNTAARELGERLGVPYLMFELGRQTEALRDLSRPGSSGNGDEQSS
jgi:GAF domain-containing protein/CHASE3 domain sensor protein